MFKLHEKVTENGLIAFQGLVVGMGEQMVDITNIGSYIKYALQSKDNDCAKLACGIISDLSSSMGEKMSEYLDDFVPCLHEILRDQQLDRRIKLPTLTALGDLCMYSGDQFNQKYFDSTISILEQAARTSVSVAGHNEETLEFLRELREVIIDQYIIILMALGDSSSQDRFIPHLENVFNFIEQTINIEGIKSARIWKLVLGLVGDIATAFPQNKGVY